MQRPFVCLVVLALAATAHAQDALQWSGFGIVRATSEGDDRVSSQLQVGIDWTPHPRYTAHLHLLGRTNVEDDAKRGHVGVVEAYLEANFRPKGDRLRLRGGAMFLPTSRENIDALWESPYAITSSALNTWLGEELRPIGVDATWNHRGLMAGATLFRGNDTFGAIPAVRGWSMNDNWILLGEWKPVDVDFTSVSAENDGRLGWSARVGWSGANVSVQATHIDNRGDGLPYGELYGWNTKWDIASVEVTHGDWTFIAEDGWGPTYLVVEGTEYTSRLDAGYVLASRRWNRGRLTARIDRYRVETSHDTAWTIAWLWTPPGRLRPGIELASAAGDQRAIIELRYSFSKH